jgi:hypothetical protein
MKRIRGKGLFWLLWLLPLIVSAETTYGWDVTQSKTKVGQYEAVAVEYRCRFNNEGYEYIIEFNPPKETSAYRLELESAGEKIVDERRINTYRFILFPKRPGELKLELNASMQHTSRESIENTVIGRDNVEKVAYTTQEVSLPAVTLDVAPHDATVAGHLQLSVTADRKRVEAFSPVQVKIVLEGYGNIDRLAPLDVSIAGVKQFEDSEQKKLRLGDNGFEGTITRRIAIVSDHDFTIPSLHLRYYDTQSGRVVELASEVIAVTVSAKPELPVSDSEAASSVARSEEASWSWLHLLLALMAGIVIGRFLLPVGVEEDEQNLPIPKKLRRCKDAKKFIAYLVMLDAQRYEEMIDEIELKLKKGEKVDLSVYKKRLRDSL